MLMNYLDRIKQVKKERGITNDELSKLTGIPMGTISKLLAGLNDSPKFSNVVAICEALQCDVGYIVTGVPCNENNFFLNDDEVKFMETYRRLDAHAKELLGVVARKELERVGRIESEAAESGSKVVELPSRNVFAERAAERSIGASYTGHTGVPLKRRIMLYDMAVSAGCGVFLDDDRASEITIPDTAKSCDADFALKVAGNSMEPRYKDGDYILVKSTDSVEVGEIGVFVLDGEGYVKVFGGDRLISLNAGYAPIPLKDFSNVRCVGAVTGKIKRK